MRTTEFAGAPLVAGSVTGVRAFDIDSLGRLHGVTHKQVWTPGENVAECKVRVVSRERAALEQERRNRDIINGGVTWFGQPERFRIEGEAHDIGSCSCGFYAYYSGGNDYATDDRVQAVIEGWGETAIGTRGFRTSKARIVALCIQGQPSPAQETWKSKTVGSVADKYGGIAAAAICVPGLAINAARSDWLWTAILGVLILANIALWIMGRARRTRRARQVKTSTVVAPVIDMAKVRRNYPDVPVFTDFKRMVAEFPTSRGEEPTPETDPDFWSRGV